MKGWWWSLQNRKISGYLGPLLLYYIGCTKLKQIFTSRHYFSCNAFDGTDWGAVVKRIHYSTLDFQVWAVNQVIQFFVTGNVVVMMGSWDNDTCYCCHLYQEDTYHLIRFSQQYMKDAFYAKLDTLRQQLEALDNSPVLLSYIIEFLNSSGSTYFPKNLHILHLRGTTLGQQGIQQYHHFM